MSKSAKPINTRSGKSLSNPVTVLLTGFDAFAGDRYNPSQLVVESFPDVLKIKASGRGKPAQEIQVRKQVLPTAGARGWKVLEAAMDSAVAESNGPVMVIMLGLAASRQALSLERFAMNFRDYRLADNDGQKPLAEAIEAGAPQLLESSHDLLRLQEVLNTAGYPSEVSNHAGTFVCNDLYFRALSYQRQISGVDSVLFVHLPLEDVFARTARKARNKRTPKALSKRLKGITKAGKSRQIKLLRRAIAEVAKIVAA